MEKESMFLTYIRATLKKWVGFQVAIDEMGGPYAQEKEAWLGTEIENYFKSYNDVEPEDLEYYVATMIDNEFDSYFEDGSLFEICKLFCKAYSLSQIDPNAPMFQVLKRVPAASSRTSNISSQNEEITVDTVETTANNAETTTLDDVASAADNVTTQLTELAIEEPEGEGWTVVNRKHKR